MPSKLTREAVQARIDAVGRGITMIGEYRSNRVKVAFQCTQGHDWLALPKDVMRGFGCPHCAGQARWNRERFVTRLKEREIELVGAFVNVNTRTTFRCSRGHTWATAPMHLISGHGCPHCAGVGRLSLETVNARIADRGLHMTGPYRNNRYRAKFTCSNGHEWQTSPSHVLTGKGCPHCYGNTPLSSDEINKRLELKQIVMLDVHDNVASRVRFACRNGHQWVSTPHRMMTQSGCPRCARGTSDFDAVYIWRAKDECFQGRYVFKVGVTSNRLADRRIRKNATTARKQAELVILAKVADAINVEKHLLKIGVDPQYRGFDGATEFRAMNDHELSQAIAYVRWVGLD